MDESSDPLGLGPDWAETRPEKSRGSGVDTAPDPQSSYVCDEEPPPYVDEAPPLEDPWAGMNLDEVPPFDDGYYAGDESTWNDGDIPSSAYEDLNASGRTSGPVGFHGGFAPKPHRRLPDAGPSGDPEQVLDVIRDVLASLHGRPASEVADAVSRIRAAEDLIDRLDTDTRRTLIGVLEALKFECQDLDGIGIVQFQYVASLGSHRAEVRDELELLKRRREETTLVNPVARFEALLEDLQSGLAKQAALRLVEAIDKRLPAEERMQAFRSLTPPTRQRSVENNTFSRSARDWEQETEAVRGNDAEMVLSSGYPTFDAAVSVEGETVGFIKPGEFWVFGAGSGHGKSSFTRRLVPAVVEDLVNGYGLSDAKAILAITEEEPIDVLRAMQVGRGQPYHHLAGNIQLVRAGESRRRLIYAVYDCVRDAVNASHRTGRPVTDFLPYLFVLDYIQSIKEPGENAYTEGVDRTADLLMRGIAAWDQEMMSSLSGEDFRSYAGMDWPEGIEHHRVAVVVLSQLTKEGKDVSYRAGKSKMADFSLLDENGEPQWEVLEGDYAVPTRADLRGSATLTQHATGVVFLHRSQPKTPLAVDPATGKFGPLDKRARFIVDKARKAVRMPYIPVRYDSNPDGKRGQFYDDLAHKYGVLTGRLKVADSYTREGDPMLPIRPSRSPFRDIRY